jgi:hypothetical protein
MYGYGYQYSAILKSGGGGGGGGFDADYQAVLDYGTTQGYTLPSGGQQTLQNDLVVALKAAGVWSKLDTFANFATDGDSDFALIDWIRLSDYTAVNSPTFTTDEGFTGNGTSAYINTNFNPTTQVVNYTLNNASRYYFHFAGTNLNIEGTTSSQRNQIRLGSNTANHTINSIAPLSANYVYSTTKGTKSIHRTSLSAVTLIDEKTATDLTQTSDIIPNENQFILRRGSGYSNNATFGYAMGASLVAENNDFVDAINAYINSI